MRLRASSPIGVIVFLFLLQTTQASLLELDFSADAYARGYSVERPQGDESAFAQRLRLSLDIEKKQEEQTLAIRTKTLLSADRWDGDTPNNNTAISGSSDDGGGGHAVRLDVGFLEYSASPNSWTLRAGRQESNWAECLTSCDDRRDRLMLMKNFAGTFVFAVFDKRLEQSYQNNRDDGDMFAAIALRFRPRYELGLLLAYWQNSDSSYVLQDVINFSPYLKYRFDHFEMALLINWLGKGSESSWFPDSHTAAAFQLKVPFGQLSSIEAQTLQVFHGGYLSTGYDTFIPTLNSNPEHNQSHIQSLRIGGFGSFSGGRDHREELYSLRLNAQLSQKIKLSPSVGYLRLSQSGSSKQFNHIGLGLQATYQLAGSSYLDLQAGRFMGDDYLSAASANFVIDFQGL